MPKKQKNSNGVKVLFVASECTPIAKVGGLGDVVGSLPKALKKLGLDVRIMLPKYKVIDFKKYPFRQINKYIYQGFLPDSKVLVYLLENERFFGENNIYFDKSAFVSSFKEIERFLFFSQAILEVLPPLKWSPDIIHCHDWHTAIVAALLKLKVQNSKLKSIKTLLTIHNLANQGKWGAKEVFDFLGFKAKKEGEFNILKQGILNADILNTVSPNYAREIQTEEFGEGLDKELLKRKKDLYGILNGIDKKRFNPEIDPLIKTNYSLENLEKKGENKIHLQEILKFEQDPKIPLIGFIGRLTSQKGIDLIIKIVPNLIKFNCQLAILGVGQKRYEQELSVLNRDYPRNISANIKFDVPLAQKIYAGSDIFLMPSRFEPCGLGQLISMAYGTLPIVRKTGGLADTIEDGKTGFVFQKYSQDALLICLKRVLKIYQDKKEWQRLMRKAMKKDFSWKTSAQKYLNLYKKLL